MHNLAGAHESHSVSFSSVSGVVAEVGAALEHLPVAEVDELVVTMQQIRETVQALAADSSSAEAGNMVEAMGVAAEKIGAAQSALHAGATALREYVTDITGQAPAAAATADIGRQPKAHYMSQEMLEQAEDVAERLLSLATSRTTSGYLAELERQPDVVLCELLRRGVPFVDHVLIARHRRLLYKQANAILSHREPRGVEADDLVAAGAETFLRYSRKYVGAKYELTTYAGTGSWYTMQDTAREEGANVAVPVDVHGIILSVRRLNAQREQEGKPRLTDQEISAMFDLPLRSDLDRYGDPRRRTVQDVRRAEQLTTYLSSLGTGYGLHSEPGLQPVDQEAPPDPLEGALQSALQELLHEAMQRTLTSREIAVLRARYGFDNVRTYRKLAEEWGVSPMRIRQIEKAALKKMAARHRYLVAFLQAD